MLSLFFIYFILFFGGRVGQLLISEKNYRNTYTYHKNGIFKITNFSPGFHLTNLGTS